VELEGIRRNQAVIVVHHLNDSRSQRILWLLEELDVPYEVKCYQRDERTRRAPPELKEIHLLGKSPVITDDGKVVAESGTIIDYILRRHGHRRLRPDPASTSYDDYVHWMHYAEGSATPALIVRGTVARLGDAGASLTPGFDAEVANHLGDLNKALEGRPYILGDDLSAADIQLSFVGEVAAARIGITAYSDIASWIRRFQARPPYRAALRRGGTYSFA
jgi:glutathione S-transferase